MRHYHGWRREPLSRRSKTWAREPRGPWKSSTVSSRLSLPDPGARHPAYLASTSPAAAPPSPSPPGAQPRVDDARLLLERRRRRERNLRLLVPIISRASNVTASAATGAAASTGTAGSAPLSSSSSTSSGLSENSTARGGAANRSVAGDDGIVDARPSAAQRDA